MTTSITYSRCDTEYNNYLATIALPDESLFTTDVDLWPIYLSSFHEGGERQFHNCNACRRFIQRFGGLVTLDADGAQKSAVWIPENAPENIRTAIENMADAVCHAKVTGVFLSHEKTLGTPATGEWTHLAAENPKVYKFGALNAHQKVAEKTENYNTVSRALPEFDVQHLRQAVALLTSDALYRSEKVLGPVQWLLRVKTDVLNTKNRRAKENIVWRAIAGAPSGYCHIRTSMAGTLLRDLSDGIGLEEATRRFAAKMHPLRYQRPVAPPKSGAIDAAEKLVEKLGLQRSFERRYATLSDMECLWTPVEEAKLGVGVFGKLRLPKPSTQSVSAGNVTWVKFARDILPIANSIQVWLSPGRQSFAVFTAAVHDDAPVLFQWDNAVAWYYVHGGSYPTQYSLRSGWNDVEGVCLLPHAWGGQSLPNFQNEFAMLIKGARETRNESASIFPESLKSEFHGIRSVVEAHSNSEKIQANGGPHAVGLGIGSRVKVVSDATIEYTIDRWE